MMLDNRLDHVFEELMFEFLPRPTDNVKDFPTCVEQMFDHSRHTDYSRDTSSPGARNLRTDRRPTAAGNEFR
ncbi:hypothetical protein NS14008_10565 [Nocardia seriolae]|nr:hypothetical protein NS14008_10565 [Nocardia seriolae]PSK32583.1 hypothetical protein C6575_04815 [Nocardia seriolae]